MKRLRKVSNEQAAPENQMKRKVIPREGKDEEEEKEAAFSQPGHSISHDFLLLDNRQSNYDFISSETLKMNTT